MSSRWDLPEPLATAEVRTTDDTVIVLRRHGNLEGPRLVVSHGNGFATDMHYPFWSLLAEGLTTGSLKGRVHAASVTVGQRLVGVSKPTEAFALVLERTLAVFAAVDLAQSVRLRSIGLTATTGPRSWPPRSTRC